MGFGISFDHHTGGCRGFTALAVMAAGLVKFLFYVFLTLFLASLVGHLVTKA